MNILRTHILENDKSIKIIAISISKKIKDKFFLDKCSQLQNPEPGTVISGKSDDDFFMIS